MTDNTALTQRDVELIALAICNHLTEKSSLSDLRNSLKCFKLDSDNCRAIATSEISRVREALLKTPDLTVESPDKKWLMINLGDGVRDVSDVWFTPAGANEPLHIGKQHIQILGDS